MTTQTTQLCTTTSGPLRCLKKVNAQGEHEGDCEAQAPEYARQTVFVAKHGYWFDACKKHERVTKHDARGCIECAVEPKT